MLKDKDKGMDGVNELNDDVLEQAAGGRILESKYLTGRYTEDWKPICEPAYEVFDNEKGRYKGFFTSKSEAEEYDNLINGE